MAGIDASIPLGIHPAQIGGAPSDPVSTISKFAEIQNSLNQNKLFQQTFAARQRAGQIISASPDLDTAMQALYRDPQVAPFASNIANEYRQVQQTMLGIAKTKQEAVQAGVAPFMKTALGPASLDPGTWNTLKSANMAQVSPEFRDDVGKSIDSIRDSVLDGLDKLPDDQKLPTAQRRLASLAIANGMDMDELWGPREVHDTGGQLVSGRGAMTPGGGFIPATALGKSLSPQVTELYGPDGSKQPTVVGGEGGSGQGSGLLGMPGGTPPAPGAAPLPGALMGGGGGAQPAAQPGLTGNPGLARGALGLPSPTQEQSAVNTSIGGTAGDLQKEMTSAAADIPLNLDRISRLEGAMQGFQSGGGADWRGFVGKQLQAIHNASNGKWISQSFIDDVANGSLSKSQIFDIHVKPLAMELMKTAIAGTGPARLPEITAFIEAADKTNDPEALMNLFSRARFGLQLKYAESQAFPQFKALIASGKLPKGTSTADFHSWFNDQVDMNNLPKGNKNGSLQFEPPPAGSARGTSAPGGPSGVDLDRLLGVGQAPEAAPQ